MNEDAAELLERRIAERVETKVRGRLFGFYAALGSVAIAAMGLVGYNLVSELDDKAKEFAMSAVTPAIEQAQQAAMLAGNEAAQATAKLEALEGFQALREAALVEQERNVRKTETRVRQMAADTGTRLTAINNDLAETEKQILAIREKTEEAAGLGNVAAVAATLEELSKQVGLLESQIREIRTRTGGDQGYDTPLADTRRIDAIQAAAAQQAQTINDVTESDSGANNERVRVGRSTVYFQFAGVTREVAEGISARLAPLGFDVPGEERIGTAEDKHEVRYFFTNDRNRAEALAEVTNMILRETGYSAEVTATNFSDFARQKPRPGTLELWLEPVPER